MEHIVTITLHQQDWGKMLQQDKISIKGLYSLLINDNGVVSWRHMMTLNHANPREILNLWLMCHGRLPIKDKLYRFDFIQETVCSLCKVANESLEHLFFE